MRWLLIVHAHHNFNPPQLCHVVLKELPLLNNKHACLSPHSSFFCLLIDPLHILHRILYSARNNSLLYPEPNPLKKLTRVRSRWSLSNARLLSSLFRSCLCWMLISETTKMCSQSVNRICTYALKGGPIVSGGPQVLKFCVRGSIYSVQGDNLFRDR